MANPKIELIPLKNLLPDEHNARMHDDRQIRKIANSIDTFGFNNPILIDPENRIIAGHGRFEAAKLLEVDAVPCVCLDHLSETERRACSEA